MRSLILISVYLSKDLFNRWLETPGAVLARVLIAVSLCLLFLFMSAGFSLTEQAMEKKIESFGVNTMIVRSIGPSPGQSRAEMGQLLEPLGEQGTYFPFSMLYVNATLNSGKKGRIVLYDDASLPALAQLLGGLSKIRKPVFLTAYGYPEAMVERVSVRDFFFDAEVLRPPQVLRFVSLNVPVLFIPRSMGAGLANYTVQESVLFMARDPSELPGILKTTESLLKAEGFDRVELSSPIQWIGELEDIRGLRLKAQAFGGSFVALLIVLIFGSIAVFEYRQNVFATALFKSFGLHWAHLALRYLADSVFWLLLAFLLALELAKLFHAFVFSAAGFDAGLLDLTISNPYQFAGNQVLLLVLLVASLVAVLPVCLALRKPVGEVLG